MNRIFFLVIFLITCVLQVFASGRTETAADEVTPQNNEWTLCITNIDSSALPRNRVNIADMVARKLVNRLSSISVRNRISPEYAYYEEYAWTRDRSAAARALAAKVEERSQLLFRGEPDWRYRRNIERLNTEIERLREVFEEAESTAPLINDAPVFKLTQGNLDLSFPVAPQAGGENRFCTAQRVDAFLASSISFFHGRYVLNLKLYTVYTRSFVWQDSIIFSNDDLENAIEEITRRLIIVLSGNEPAAVAINAEPEETLILINRSFAGRGETNILEYPPGTILVTATAANHESLTFETDLSSGEFAQINIRLHPIEYIEIDVEGGNESRVYHGALYVGESPYTLRLPLNNLEYVELEALNSERGTVVFRTPNVSDNPQSLSLNMTMPSETGRVDRMRRHYYWSWGGVWVTGITAWLSYYSLNSSASVIQSGNYTDDFANTHTVMNYVFTGSLIALGVAGAYCIYRLVRYLYTANRGATPVAVPSARVQRPRIDDSEVTEEQEMPEMHLMEKGQELMGILEGNE